MLARRQTPDTSMKSSAPFTISGIDPALTPYLRLLLLVAIWSATLVPLLLMLMFFSSERLRRTPVFWLNVLATSLGMALGIASIIFTVSVDHLCEVLSVTVSQYSLLVDPDDGYSISITVTILCFEFVTPFLVEFILLCRLLAVYSFHVTPFRLFASIFCSLGCLKMARIANFIVFITYYARHARKLVNPLSLSLARCSPKIEWILQTIDNMSDMFYAVGYMLTVRRITSSLFLRQLNLRQVLGYRIQENGRHAIVCSSRYISYFPLHY